MSTEIITILIWCACIYLYVNCGIFTFRAFSWRFYQKRLTINTFVIRSASIYRCRYRKDVHRTKCKYHDPWINSLCYSHDSSYCSCYTVEYYSTIQYNTIEYNTIQCTMVARRGRVATQSPDGLWTGESWVFLLFNCRQLLWAVETVI